MGVLNRNLRQTEKGKRGNLRNVVLKFATILGPKSECGSACGFLLGPVAPPPVCEGGAQNQPKPITSSHHRINGGILKTF